MSKKVTSLPNRGFISADTEKFLDAINFEYQHFSQDYTVCLQQQFGISHGDAEQFVNIGFAHARNRTASIEDNLSLHEYLETLIRQAYLTPQHLDIGHTIREQNPETDYPEYTEKQPLFDNATHTEQAFISEDQEYKQTVEDILKALTKQGKTMNEQKATQKLISFLKQFIQENPNLLNEEEISQKDKEKCEAALRNFVYPEDKVTELNGNVVNTSTPEM